MTFVAGSHEWLKAHGYAVRRTGPLVWTVTDEEDGAVVCQAKNHADAVRELLRLRFSD